MHGKADASIGKKDTDRKNISEKRKHKSMKGKESI